MYYLLQKHRVDTFHTSRRQGRDLSTLVAELLCMFFFLQNI